MLAVSAAEFRRHFGRLKRRDREVLRVGELSDADLAAIAATEMDARHDPLNAELE